ncbi:MAG TPA: polysaccharide deacetylase family protein [Candidatus Butyricicoccus stercorigallinarum]|nr:polysaccharide deacetylase family protein [Candidatus Butyricicoccus stercorigallinarum]
MRLFAVISGKKLALGAAVLAVICVTAHAVWGAKDILLASATKKDLPIYSVEREEKICSLTFDAAWGNEDTAQLIEILGEHDIRATFFVVGEWAEKYPESVKQLADAGHEVMNHSSTHPHMTELSTDAMIEEVRSCNEKIERITGTCPTLFRPPYGDYNDAVVSTLRSIGMYTIQWDVDSLDWKDPAPEEIVRRVVDNARSGSIILFHNAAKNTPAALPDVIDGLCEKGFSFAPVSELIYTGSYTIDHTGRQIPDGEAAGSGA